MNEIGSKKIEKKAINKIRTLLDDIDNFDYNFAEDDTGISWDGYINVYKGNVDIKSNFLSRIDAQIKGRTTTLKKLQDKCKFDIAKSDLENYLKLDGTIFFLVRFKNKDEYKIYYGVFLPKNLHMLLNQATSSKKQVKVQLKELKDKDDLEKICMNFIMDRDKQKKLPYETFNELSVHMGNNANGIFFDWNKDKIKPTELIGKEKYFYVLDDNEKIIDVQYGEIFGIVENVNVAVKSISGKIFFDSIQFETGAKSRIISFGKAFSLLDGEKKFTISLKGTLFERIHQLEFVKTISDEKGFYIGEFFFGFSADNMFEAFNQIYDNYIRIKNFFEKQNIKKDINLDNWNNNDQNQLLSWIDAIDNKTEIEIPELKGTSIGPIIVNDIKIGVFVEQQKSGKFILYTIWNDSKRKEYLFGYKHSNGSTTSTTNLFSILKKDLYLTDNINFEEMKKSFVKKPLVPKEEDLILLEVLEIIDAYDINKNCELLSYAKFLLEIISTKEIPRDIIRINYLQIEKRLRELNESEIQELIEIRNRNEDLAYKISANLLIGNIKEAEIDLKKLSKEEYKNYTDYPIYHFFKE